jgi:hypothetical protein
MELTPLPVSQFQVDFHISVFYHNISALQPKKLVMVWFGFNFNPLKAGCLNAYAVIATSKIKVSTRLSVSARISIASLQDIGPFS